MRSLTNLEKAYNDSLSRVSKIDYYVQTACDRRDENYFNKLLLKALIKQEEEALKEYSKIQKISSMTKEERAELLEYDENGELKIQRYGLSEYSKIYVLSKYLDIRDLLKIEGNREIFGKLKKFGVPETEILKIVCDEKNKRLQELILTAQLEDTNGELLPVSNIIFKEENVQKLLFLSDTCSIDIIKNIIKGKYGDLNGNEADLIVLNSVTDGLERVLKDAKLFARKNGIARRSIKKVCNNKKFNEYRWNNKEA